MVVVSANTANTSNVNDTAGRTNDRHSVIIWSIVYAPDSAKSRIVR